MKKSLLILGLSIFFLNYAAAHDPKQHKGHMLEGKVVLLENDVASVKTEKETVKVILSPSTKFELGMEGEESSRARLKEGQFLMITGHKLESGEFAATEVMIHEVE